MNSVENLDLEFVYVIIAITSNVDCSELVAVFSNYACLSYRQAFTRMIVRERHLLRSNMRNLVGNSGIATLLCYKVPIRSVIK